MVDRFGDWMIAGRTRRGKEGAMGSSRASVTLGGAGYDVRERREHACGN